MITSPAVEDADFINENIEVIIVLPFYESRIRYKEHSQKNDWFHIKWSLEGKSLLWFDFDVTPCHSSEKLINQAQPGIENSVQIEKENYLFLIKGVY